MPAAVYTAGCAMGTEKYSLTYALNMVVVTIGVAAASYGGSWSCQLLDSVRVEG